MSCLSAPSQELLERVFLKLGVAESDAQLEKVLGRFLPPVLLKGASPSPAVRSKVRPPYYHTVILPVQGEGGEGEVGREGSVSSTLCR